MKKLFIVSFILTAIGSSGTSMAMGSALQNSEACADAFNALQLTRSSVLSDLQHNMQSSFSSMQIRTVEGFGIDDTKSYAQQEKTTLSRLGIEG